MQHDHNYFVYIITSKPQGTLYIGVTNNLRRRTQEHRDGEGSKFSKQYRVARLVWFEHHGDINAAIQREKSLKRWPRDWKANLIERENPHWKDLYPSLIDGA
jgi:putative endonuclease